MKKYVYTIFDLALSMIIALLLTNMIRNQMTTEQSLKQDLQMKISQQHVNKAISLLEGDHLKIRSSQVAYPNVGEKYAVIHNDARDFVKEVYFGDSSDILDISIGQYANSGIPGEGRPILLAGHNGTHFKQLQYFEKGDHVMIDTDYGSFVYEVTDMETKYYYDFDVKDLEKKEELLMMYCCYPFDSLSTDIRYFVYAKKIDGPQIVGDGSWKE